MGYFFMFIELTTAHRGEKVTFNSDNIVIITPDKRGTFLVDVNGIDWIVSEPYEVLKAVLQTFDYDKSYKMV